MHGSLQFDKATHPTEILRDEDQMNSVSQRHRFTRILNFVLSCVVLLIWTATLVAADEKAGQAATNAPSAIPPNEGAVPADVQAAVTMPVGPDRRTALVAAVTAWAKSNPADALTWAVHKDKADKEFHKEFHYVIPWAICDIWLANDEKGALEWAINHVGDERAWMIGDYTGHQKTAEDVVNVADWVIKQPKGSGLMGVVVEAWCKKEGGTEVAANWIVKQKLSTGDASAGIFYIAVSKARQNPSDAVDWLAKLPEGFPRDAAAKGVAYVWSKKLHLTFQRLRIGSINCRSQMTKRMKS